MSSDDILKIKRRNLKTLINIAYKSFLFREVDKQSLEQIVKDMENNSYDIDGLIDGLINSEEYKNRNSNLEITVDTQVTRHESYRVSQILRMLESL